MQACSLVARPHSDSGNGRMGIAGGRGCSDGTDHVNPISVARPELYPHILKFSLKWCKRVISCWGEQRHAVAFIQHLLNPTASDSFQALSFKPS